MENGLVCFRNSFTGFGLNCIGFMKENTNTIINFKEEKMKINNRLNKSLLSFFYCLLL